MDRACAWRANSTIKIAFLAARPTRTTNPICANTSTDISRISKPVTAASRHIGTINTTANGSFQLSYCAANTKEHEQSGCAKNQQARRAGLRLLERYGWFTQAQYLLVPLGEARLGRIG